MTTSLKPLLLLVSVFLLSSCSPTPEVVTGPFFVKDGILYEQDTNERVTGIVESDLESSVSLR